MAVDRAPSALRLYLPFADVVLGRQSPLWSLVSRDVGVMAMRLCWPLMCESPHGLISTPVFYVSGSVSRQYVQCGVWRVTPVRLPFRPLLCPLTRRRIDPQCCTLCCMSAYVLDHSCCSVL